MLILAILLACVLHKKRKAGRLNLFYSESLPPRVPVILQDELYDENQDHTPVPGQTSTILHTGQATPLYSIDDGAAQEVVDYEDVTPVEMERIVLSPLSPSPWPSSWTASTTRSS